LGAYQQLSQIRRVTKRKSHNEMRRMMMNNSFLTAQPQMLTAVAGGLQGIGSAVEAGNAAAAAPTTGVVPAAADEVSAQFAAHAQMYQVVSAQAAAIHQLFVAALGASAASYAATEAANAVAVT
jgi:hypothetical protein